jgi:hypothetical protein
VAGWWFSLGIVSPTNKSEQCDITDFVKSVNDHQYIPGLTVVTVLPSVLLVEETGVPGENHRPVASH